MTSEVEQRLRCTCEMCTILLTYALFQLTFYLIPDFVAQVNNRGLIGKENFQNLTDKK